MALGHSLGCALGVPSAEERHLAQLRQLESGLDVLPQEPEAVPCSFQLCSGHEVLECRQWPGFGRHASDQRKVDLLLLEKLLELLFSMRRWGN